jgi:hypothetical protein
MMAVLLSVLSVLKIIGIVLLCILGLVLFILLLVLFVPVRYRLDALIPETDLEEGFDAERMDISARFSWLLFVIRGGISFPKNKEFTLRVCGIRILPKKDKGDKKEQDKEGDEAGKDSEEASTGSKKAKKDKAEAKKGDEEAGSDKTDAQKDKEEAESDSQDSIEADEDKASSEADGEGGSSEDKGGFDKDPEQDDKSFLDVLWSIFDGIDNFLKTPLNVFEKIQYTISRVCDKIDMIKSTLENDIFKRAFELVKKKLIRILKMILPDKCDIDLLFGSGDPATTAEIMAAYSALYPVLFKNVRYTPDFERKVVFADAHLNGHITLFTILYSAAVCYFNKDVKKTIRRFKKIMES